ncbi:unnamed protein product [Peronospora belbahrii]|uniref:Uncharacterized protein n=1 Tax=Peronospora belbahrii TaxID=622444 RepID=A0ABN8D022_9STRA|nr:unnamed protein product [Peronospora belbahrii]
MPPMTSSPVASTSNSPTKTPLSMQRPKLSPRKRKFSASDATSPTSLDEVNNNRPSSPLEGRVISPKKKVKAEEHGSTSDLSKWEHHVVASIANALDLDGMEMAVEPISFSLAPAGDLAADELEILCCFLA